MVPNLIEDHHQLVLTIYRLVHGSWFKVIMDIFRVPQSLAREAFNNVIKCRVVTVYDKFVCLPITEAYWANECKGFIENYEFPCVGEWGGFHVRVASRLKNYFSFKTNTRLRV